ncbi:hypothetical protein J3R74_001082 [Puniceicoccus vermicola]
MLFPQRTFTHDLSNLNKIWNFADFRTPQNFCRANGKKRVYLPGSNNPKWSPIFCEISGHPTDASANDCEPTCYFKF